MPYPNKKKETFQHVLWQAEKKNANNDFYKITCFRYSARRTLYFHHHETYFIKDLFALLSLHFFLKKN